MTHEQAFLAAICEASEDDTPRLVYADWLEEQGRDERAEFIRVQIQLARNFVTNSVPDPDVIPVSGGKVALAYARSTYRKWKAMKDRERELWAWHGDEWLGTPLASLTKLRDGVLSAMVRIRRGFVESVDCTYSAWLAHGPAIVAVQPVTRVRLTDRKPSFSSIDGLYDWYIDDLTRQHTRDACLPAELLDLLDLEFASGGGYQSIWRKSYRTEQVALDALSQACVMWAKSRVQK